MAIIAGQAVRGDNFWDRPHQIEDIIDIIGIHHFSSRQSIAIVKIGKDKFLLGITPENISLLAKLNIAENSQDSIITNYNENENNPLEQKAVNLIKEKFGKLKRL